MHFNNEASALIMRTQQKLKRRRSQPEFAAHGKTPIFLEDDDERNEMSGFKSGPPTHSRWSTIQRGLVAKSIELEDASSKRCTMQSSRNRFQLRRRVQEPRFHSGQKGLERFDDRLAGLVAG
jgi:hypothetical protein